MATGSHHYQEAEYLLERAHHYIYGDGGDVEVGLGFAAMAQVHATLADTAASALAATQMPVDGKTAQAWRDLIAEPKPHKIDGCSDCRDGTCQR
jgi:hypothetical protein